MASEKAHQRKTSILKRLGFVFLGLAAFFLAATVILEILERAGIVSTERLDDRVAYAPTSLLCTRLVDGKKVRAIENPFMIPSVYPKKKSPDTFRMFVTGGSFAMGSPYMIQGDMPSMDVGIPGWLRMELSQRYPSKNVEMINAAAGGQNSFRVRAIVEQLVGEKADLILVATGNNEGFVPATFANEPLHHWIVYRLMKRLVKPSELPESRERYMVQASDPKNIAAHYRKNIEQIIKACKKKKVPLALATLPINLKYPELGKTLRDDEYLEKNRDSWCRQGEEAFAQGEYEQAALFFAKSENKEYAAWMMGVCNEKLGRFEQAKVNYRKVVEWIPFNRMRPSFNEYLRRVSAEQGLILVDLDKTLEKRSPNGILQPEAFFDSCHMTWQGYHFAAMEVADVLIKNKIIQGKPGEPLSRLTEKEMIEKYNLESIYTLQMTGMQSKGPATGKADGEHDGF